MGRGATPRVRWKNDRIKKKKEREKRQAAAAGEARKGGTAAS
ncbi:MAG TPA: hypothetical protein VHN98_06230 [Acidimicrobiales bacterium]|nr:hypothetical protein [Acidimicrobiales bacterium]